MGNINIFIIWEETILPHGTKKYKKIFHISSFEYNQATKTAATYYLMVRRVSLS